MAENTIDLIIVTPETVDQRGGKERRRHPTRRRTTRSHPAVPHDGGLDERLVERAPQHERDHEMGSGEVGQALADGVAVGQQRSRQAGVQVAGCHRRLGRHMEDVGDLAAHGRVVATHPVEQVEALRREPVSALVAAHRHLCGGDTVKRVADEHRIVELAGQIKGLVGEGRVGLRRCRATVPRRRDRDVGGDLQVPHRRQVRSGPDEGDQRLVGRGIAERRRRPAADCGGIGEGDRRRRNVAVGQRSAVRGHEHLEGQVAPHLSERRGRSHA